MTNTRTPLCRTVFVICFGSVFVLGCGSASSVASTKDATSVSDMRLESTDGGVSDGAPSDGGRPTDAAPTDTELCQSACDMSNGQGCLLNGVSACVQNCNDAFTSVATCAADFRRVMTCQIAVGPTSIVCANGSAMIVAGVCEVEKASLTACLSGLPTTPKE